MNGILRVQYYFDGFQPILELDGNGNLLRTFNPGISFTKFGKRYFYLYNGHGDVANLTDVHGHLVQAYQYAAFGGLAAGMSDKFNGSRYVGGADVDCDDDTGLQYMGYRWYDPGLGKFISRDPIGFAGGDLNLYRYAENNPTNRIDPLGLSAWTQFWGGAATAVDVVIIVVVVVVVAIYAPELEGYVWAGIEALGADAAWVVSEIYYGYTAITSYISVSDAWSIIATLVSLAGAALTPADSGSGNNSQPGGLEPPPPLPNPIAGCR